MARPPRIPNWLGWNQTTIYLITLCVEDRKPLLANLRVWEICLATFERLDQWNILAAIDDAESSAHSRGANKSRSFSFGILEVVQTLV